MADTQFIKRVIEPFMRKWLELRFQGQLFQERPVPLPDGEFRFDAVSEDGSIVGLFMCNRPRTSSGNENSGAVKKALNDIHYLKLLTGQRVRLAVFTDDGFRDLVLRRSRRIGSDGIELLHCKLPKDLEQALCENLDACRQEQRSRSDGPRQQPALKVRSNEVLPIELVPTDANEFRSAVIKSGMAKIAIYYGDGRTKTLEWRIGRLSPSSSIIGNLRSRPQFRQGEWQRCGIVRIVVFL